MPIYIASNFIPKSLGPFPLIEDTYLLGGFRIVATTTDRDAITTLRRKEGMLVLVKSDSRVYQLAADLTTWVDFTEAAGTHVHELVGALDGFMSAADKAKLDGIEAGAIAYEHPVANGYGHLPETDATTSGKILVAGVGSNDYNWQPLPELTITRTAAVASEVEMLALTADMGDVAVRTDLSKTFILAGSDASVLGNWQELLTPAQGVTAVSANLPLTITGDAKTPTISIQAAGSGQNGYLSAADWNTFNSKGTGSVTNVAGSGAISVSNGSTTPTISIAAATASVPGTMSAADKAKLDGIAAGATSYAHPTGDGNLHVPATSTTNNGKVLTAGATAGSLSWVAPTVGTVTNVTGSGAISVATGTTTPIISIAAATTSVPGTMSAADKTKLDGIASGATAYVHPTGDGSLHVPATGTANSGKVLTAGATAGSLSWVTPTVGTVTNVTATGPVASTGGATPVISMPAATTSVDGYLKATDWAIFNGKQAALGFTPYNATNPNGYTSNAGTVTSVTGSGAISVATGTTTPVISVAAATTSVPGTMSAADKAKLDGITAGANAYTHPTGDGNLHVPATSTTNSGKVLTAGATAGSLSWTTPAVGTVTNVTGSGAISVATGTTTPVISVAAATTSVPGTMSAADKTKLDGIAAGATAYAHPTGDGNLHVPATSTTNSGKVLTAGATAGSLSWAVPVATTANLQVNSLGVGTAAAGTAGDIRATGDVTAFYSDGRLKTILGPIENAVSKVMSLRGVIYTGNEVAASFGYPTDVQMAGVIAQEVQAVLPEVVAPAPFDIRLNPEGGEFSRSGENYLTVKYDRMIPLLIEAIKEQQYQIEALKALLQK